ncbi:hypothetical protein [Tenacibaculum soleae]|uniref:hypothetical protein n=1 Tax=Tenacibaculum soleae TaxID=447689 RepID=UPI0026E3DDE9|nr:hypothetical protein [Tenacibaculum soleae]MDO6813799.1 hypothetical protein [Tenacibaculum soleae]
MNKYLTKKIESSKGLLFNNFCLIAFEVLNDGKNEVLEDFECLEYSKICKTLGWIDNEEVHKSIAQEISDGGISGMMYRNGCDGFLAQINIPVCSDIKTSGNSLEPSSWSSSQGHCYVAYVYADTLGELTDKAIEQSDLFFQKDWAKQMKLQPIE